MTPKSRQLKRCKCESFEEFCYRKIAPKLYSILPIPNSFLCSTLQSAKLSRKTTRMDALHFMVAGLFVVGSGGSRTCGAVLLAAFYTLLKWCLLTSNHRLANMLLYFLRLRWGNLPIINSTGVTLVSYVQGHRPLQSGKKKKTSCRRCKCSSPLTVQIDNVPYTEE